MGTINENTQVITDMGLSIIPVSSNKTPIGKWSHYQHQRPSVEYWYNHYVNQGTIGIITGEVSGRLEIVDIDEKNDPNGTITKEYFHSIPRELINKLVVQTTPNKGYHLIYRCPEIEIEGNQKLALHTDKAVIIETRGEGGYFCTSKINNRITQGVFDIEQLNVEIPEITKQERDTLLDIARSLTRYFPQPDKTSTNDGDKPFEYKEPAINQFNSEYNIIDLFTKHGWEEVNDDGEKVSLLRPGSSSAIHSGYYFRETNTFFCFSTSTGFKSEKPYNHFQILQILEGISDYKTTLRKLAELGYEVSAPTTNNSRNRINPKDMAGYLNDVKNIRYDTFIQDLTYHGCIIEEMDYNTIYIDMKEHFDREIPRTRFEEVIKSKYIKQFNPVEQFIEDNKHRNPSGVFEKWLGGVHLKNKTVKSEFVLHFFKKWYVGMIAQALNAEYPNEFFLALLSTEQGIGKTTFFRKYVLPKELYDYRVEHSLSNDDDFKVMMSQSLLIIDDEMDGRTFEQSQSFKDILSRKKITLRRKYDRRISNIQRRCSFAGSGNNLNVIREEINRRILPIEVESFDWDILDNIDYTDLFIEAYNLYKGGYKYSYQFEDKDKLTNLYQDYIQPSDVGLVLDHCIKKPEKPEDVFFISTYEIVEQLTNNYKNYGKRINVVAIGRLLNQRGFKSTRNGKERTSGYIIHKRSLIRMFPGGDDTILLGMTKSD